MKHLFIVVLAALLLAQTACKNTWSGEDKDLFRQACMEDAEKWAGSVDKAKTYCDCVMDKVMLKFPHESDALEHMDSVINDPDVRGCKSAVMAK